MYFVEPYNIKCGMQAIRLLNFCLKLGQASKIFLLLFLRSVLLIVCVCRINGAFSELISQRRMCFIHSPREFWLCSVTIKVIYIINLSPWMPIAKFLNLYLLCCWKKMCYLGTWAENWRHSARQKHCVWNIVFFVQKF